MIPNPYACPECDWEYDPLAMVDRRKALAHHQLDHLIGERAKQLASDLTSTTRRAIEYGVDLHADAARFVMD